MTRDIRSPSLPTWLRAKYELDALPRAGVTAAASLADRRAGRSLRPQGWYTINLFVRDLPRLSVDIDLTFLPLVERNEALVGIRDALQHVAADVKNQIFEATVNASPRLDAPKLVVGARGAVIKVEPNATLRGSVYPPSVRRTTPTVETEFEQSVSVSVLSDADLYGGKLVAALDRQHPRDLFDTKLLLDAEGLTDEVRMASSSISQAMEGRSRRSWIRD